MDACALGGVCSCSWVKFCRIKALFRKYLLGMPSRTVRFRQGLERIWTEEHQRG